jgi:hypothetical protein
MSTRVLYYSWLDVHHLFWLKTALLHCDEVSILVLAGVSVLRQSTETCAAVEVGLPTSLELTRHGAVIQRARVAVNNPFGVGFTKELIRASHSQSKDPFAENLCLSSTMNVHHNKVTFTKNNTLTSKYIKIGDSYDFGKSS